MATITHDTLMNYTLPSNSSTMVISNIPNTYSYLQLIVVGSGVSLAEYGIRFNGDTGSNYYSNGAYNTDNSASGWTTSDNWLWFQKLGNGHGMGIIDIFDYADTGKLTTIAYRHGYQDPSGSGGSSYGGGTWYSAATVNSITIVGSSLASGSRIVLKGIA